MTSADASCAPPPATISGRLAAARRLAASRMASSSIVGCGTGKGAATAIGALRPQTSIAHSSTAGPGRPVPHCENGLGHEARGVAWLPDTCAEIDQPFDDAALVANLMQMSKPTADGGLRDLPDQREHRSVHSIGREERGRRIEQAGTGHDGIGLRLCGRERGAQCHVGRALLMPRMNGADAVGGPEQGVEQRIVVEARQCVDRIDSVGDERGYGRFGRRHPRVRMGRGLFSLRRFGHEARTRERAAECADRRDAVEPLGIAHVAPRGEPR